MDNRIIPTIGKHVIAEDTLARRGENVAIDESTHLRIVIARLEIVERGRSVLGLTATPDYALDTHTKPQGFRVGIFVTAQFLVQTFTPRHRNDIGIAVMCKFNFDTPTRLICDNENYRILTVDYTVCTEIQADKRRI